jgi:hypothetical protein
MKLFHAAEYLHLAYTALNGLFKEYLSVTMSNTAPNVDADTWNRIKRSDSIKKLPAILYTGKLNDKNLIQTGHEQILLW